MPEQKQRQFRIFPAHPPGNLIQIGDQRYTAVRIEVSQILRLAHTSAVSPMVVDDADEAVLRQKLEKRQIPLLVLAHAVGNLYDCPWCGFGADQKPLERQTVVVRI